ncbi:MAG: hypothetical protein HC919_14075 [Oscillatoriales cyanobacterium SM2_2_1]|nr:hypothetical protein [Oscillatoriales cyanobacterium SM2_2_1]
MNLANDIPHSLAQCLTEVLRHPQCTDPVLRNQVQAELSGYCSPPYPSWRILPITYLDRAGNALAVPSTYQPYPILYGVPTLELHHKQGLTLTLPNAVTTFLQQQLQREVFGGYVSAIQIQILLSQIRETYRQSLQLYSITSSSMP